MNFKLYDILSALVPGFLLLLALLGLFNLPFDKDLIVPYTAVSFLLGYLINTIGSWLEGFYYWTWGGNPAHKLLRGKGIWKVKFYDSGKVQTLLSAEASVSNVGDDHLFSIAKRHANDKDDRVHDFNSSYAFSRSLLTCTLLGGVALIFKYSNDWRYYFVVIAVVLVVWLRCKQRAYYYAKEVLDVYLRKKTP